MSFAGLAFLNPWALTLLAIVPPGILALYFLKLKRREVPVSSTWLWRQAMDDLRVNSPFQRRRTQLLLFLQLLIAIVLALGLGRPAARIGAGGGRDLILVLDRSASMGATDTNASGRTRLDRAKEEALRWIDDLSIGDQAMVLAFDEQAVQLQSLTDVKSLLRRAVGDLEVEPRGSALQDALSIASSMARRGGGDREAEVVVISDGAVRDAASLTGTGLNVQFVRIGSLDGAPNHAITGLDRRRALEGGESFQIFAEVANFSNQEDLVGVSMFLDDKLIDSAEVRLAAGARTSVLFSSLAVPGGLIRVALDGEDALAVDDEAWTLLPRRDEIAILVVGSGSYFLENILRIDPAVDRLRLARMAPEEFRAADPGLSKHDLIIFDRAIPDAPLPPGSYLFLDSIPVSKGLERRKMTQSVEIIEWDQSHPVSRFTDLGSLTVARARPVVPRPGDRVLLQSTAGALMVELDDPQTRSLVIAFDIYDTDWPLQASFPIFAANAMRWLAAGGAEQRGVVLRPGEVAAIPITRGVPAVTVTDPAGHAHRIEPDSAEATTVAFGGTRQVGVYEVDGAVLGHERLAVNMLRPRESELIAADRLTISGLPVVGDETTQLRNREIWWWFALAAFVVCVFEWWIYNRRVYL